MSKTCTIRFNYRGKTYQEVIPHNPLNRGAHILECYKRLGINKRYVTKPMMTFPGWNFWVGYIV